MSLKINGSVSNAVVYTEILDDTTAKQITELCNQPFTEGSKIRIMPDCHAGAGCVIGTTMTISKYVVPNLVGVDIGCGMLVIKLPLKKGEINLPEFDNWVKKMVPSGMDVHENQKYELNVDLLSLKCIKSVSYDRALLSIGTLGGGNHFIELAESSDGVVYLVIHSGSRNLGKQVAEHYQAKAYQSILDKELNIKELIQQMKDAGRYSVIEHELKKMKEITKNKINKELAYLSDNDFEDYIHDMRIIQDFASLNRLSMGKSLLKLWNFPMDEYFSTIHNYIDIDRMILRKGAISAQKDEIVLIPMNMRDGSLICRGLGNPEWNYSAPHGAGRIMSRMQAKRLLSLSDFQKTMVGVYSTTIDESTLDEAPFAYKPMKEIMENIKETVEIIDIIKPFYNFKAGE